MAQHQRKHHRQHKRFRFGRLYGVVCVLLVLVAVVGGSIVFFRVDDITVEGGQRYSSGEIIAATGIEQGDNMFLLNKFDIIDRLEEELTYLDTVVIRRKLPSTIQITVTECTVAATVRNEDTGEWWLMSAGGKLLEQGAQFSVGTTVTGLTFREPGVGTPLAVEEDQRLQLAALTEILTALEQRNMLSQAQSIDLTLSGTVTLHYADRLEVKMKLSSDFDYQVRVLEKVMEEYVLTKWGAEDTGTLDMTQSDGKPHLIRDEAEN